MILARAEVVFKHKDIYVVKKGFLVKKSLEEFDSLGFDPVWWHERGIKDKNSKPKMKIVIPPSPNGSRGSKIFN